MIDSGYWRGRRVLVTGHTGFKGAWLSLLLHQAGARVFGLSADSLSTYAAWQVFGSASVEHSMAGDVSSPQDVVAALEASKPSVVFHLAAQPIVKTAFADPIATVKSNVLGTATVLDAVRRNSLVQSLVLITSDKVFRSREGGDETFRSDSEFGGNEVYSASKASCELLAHAFRTAYAADFAGSNRGLATARAGNVIGGGDFGEGRLIPDLFRAVSERRGLEIWHPHSVRPWQHVLDVVSGYVLLAERLGQRPDHYGRGWNFANPDMQCTVIELLTAFTEQLQTQHGISLQIQANEAPRGFHEDRLLRLDVNDTLSELSWHPRLGMTEAVRLTVDWYVKFGAGATDELRMTSTNSARTYINP